MALWGDIDVKTINKQIIRKCLKAFELMPKGNKKPFNKLTVGERLNYPTDEIPEEDFISPKTVRSLLKTLQGFFSTFLTGEKDCFSQSPTANVKYTIREKRFGVYSDREIQAFESEADNAKEAWQRWVLLLAIYTGARRSEIVKFMFDGVKFDDEHQVYYFELLKGKTAAAKRKIPVHPRLIEKGVLKVSDIEVGAKAITDYINKLGMHLTFRSLIQKILRGFIIRLGIRSSPKEYQKELRSSILKRWWGTQRILVSQADTSTACHWQTLMKLC